MPQTLPQNPEQIVRDLLTDEWSPTTTAGFDPTTTDPTSDSFLPITTDWNTGDTYPIISITNNDPTVPGGGETNITGIQGDGSGPNQRRLETMQVTVQASGDTSYPTSGWGELSWNALGWGSNSLDAHNVCDLLYSEVERIIMANYNAPDDPAVWNYFITPPTHTINKSDTNSFHQYAGSVTLHWQREP